MRLGIMGWLGYWFDDSTWDNLNFLMLYRNYGTMWM